MAAAHACHRRRFTAALSPMPARFARCPAAARAATGQLQVPPLQTPEQQTSLVAHRAPAAAHWQWPFPQLPEQQSVAFVHAAAAGAHAHAPPVHVPEQQSVPTEQATAAVAHAQLPLLHAPEQQNVPSLQTAPVSPQAQVPFTQVPVQHSAADWHAEPAVVHVQVPFEAAPEQQSVAAATPVPVGAQQAPAPPQMLPGSHWAPVVHARPNEGLQPYQPSLPVQHWDPPPQAFTQKEGPPPAPVSQE